MPETTSILKPVFIASSSSPSFPTKNSRRKNHLRQKILKTLKNPIIPKLPISPTDSPPQEIKESDITHEIQEHENSDLVQIQAQGEEAQELKEVEIEVPAGAGIDGRIGLSGKNSILKYGLWFVGAFVFQTVCAVLFFGLDEIEQKRGTDNGSVELTEKDDVLGVLRTGNGNDDVGKLEMESKIEEIRLMAREVREKERLQSKRNGEDGEDGEETEGEKYSRSEIEEEVDGAMGRLRKKLEKRRFTKPLVQRSSEESRRGDGVEKGDLLYEKKYKFKEFRFLGSDDRRVHGDMEDSNEVSRSRNDDDSKKGMLEMKATEERVMSKEGKREGVAKAKVIDGNVLERNNAGSEQLGESIDLDTAVASDNLSKGNGTFRGKGFGNTKPVPKSKKESLWWSNLPYVLVIFMQRGSGSKGLYTLKSSRNAGDRLPPYAVAFEDSGDANNFCYLLESFFEDLEDFEAHVAPLTVKEVKELAESFSLRVVVVKRGQLQMYAGQPLTDAEVALGSIIDQD